MEAATIDLALHGDVAACRAAAATMQEQGSLLGDAEGELQAVYSGAARAWVGQAGDGFRQFVGGVLDESTELRRKSFLLADTLGAFADALESVRRDLAHAREVAYTGGLLVEGDLVFPRTPQPMLDSCPPAPTVPQIAPAGPQWAPADPYRVCHDVVDGARERENRAHDEFQRATEQVLQAPFLEHWLAKFDILPERTDAEGLTIWAGKSGLFGASTNAAWKAHVTYGRLAPVINNLQVPASNLNVWQRVRYGGSSSSWTARAGSEVPYAKWTATGTKLNVAGAAVSGGLAFWDQWQTDADDPSPNWAEQTGRATTVGASTGIGAYAGAVYGAQAGAALGSVFPGPGTVIGAAVGGIVGGVVGSELGGAVGTALIDGPKAALEKVKFW